MKTEENINRFLGVWYLSEWSIQKPDGKIILPFSGAVEGYLIYNQEGWVSATLMEKERPILSDNRSELTRLRDELNDSKDLSLNSDTMHHLRNHFLAAHGYIAYTGPFNVDENNVYHEIKTSLIPQWIGTTLVREYDFSSNNHQLTLSANQGKFIDQLIWKRENSND